MLLPAVPVCRRCCPRAAHCRMPWQRLLSLQVLRSLMADHQLLYVLFTSYDMSIHHDMNAVHDTLSVAVEALKVGWCWDMVGGACHQWNMRAMSCFACSAADVAGGQQ